MMTPIHQYPHLDLKSREFLPNSPGIYYILDEENIVWYIGKAKDLKSRWTGTAHHRFVQLQKQVKKRILIYYELADVDNLDQLEKLRINQHSPQLNGTRVESKKLRSTEALLRETLSDLTPYLYILGVEPPRRDDRIFVEETKKWGDFWRIQTKILPVNVIHVCFDSKSFSANLADINLVGKALSKVFRKRPNFSDNWGCKATSRDRIASWLPVTRLFCNGFAIEIYDAAEGTIDYFKDTKVTKLAGIEIQSLSAESLKLLKSKLALHLSGLFQPVQSSEYCEYCNRALQRLNPYEYDVVRILFDEDFNPDRESSIQRLKESEAQRVVESQPRIANLNKRREFMLNLLNKRQNCNLGKYDTILALQPLSLNSNYHTSLKAGKMPIYIKPFSCDLQQVKGPIVQVGGAQGQFLCYPEAHPYHDVYLEAWVEKAIWLLVEAYVFEFAKTSLSEEEGYVENYFMTSRKKLFPASLKVTLDKNIKAEVPFGSAGKFSWLETTTTLAQALKVSGINGLKFTFKAEEVKV